MIVQLPVNMRAAHDVATVTRLVAQRNEVSRGVLVRSALTLLNAGTSPAATLGLVYQIARHLAHVREGTR